VLSRCAEPLSMRSGCVPWWPETPRISFTRRWPQVRVLRRPQKKKPRKSALFSFSLTLAVRAGPDRSQRLVSNQPPIPTNAARLSTSSTSVV
jgi:hypothetical protein